MPQIPVGAELSLEALFHVLHSLDSAVPGRDQNDLVKRDQMFPPQRDCQGTEVRLRFLSNLRHDLKDRG